MASSTATRRIINYNIGKLQSNGIGEEDGYIATKSYMGGGKVGPIMIYREKDDDITVYGGIIKHEP